MKGNIRQCVKLLKNSKDFGQLASANDLIDINNISTVANILKLEGVMNVNLEHAMRAIQQKNIQNAVRFIWGPSPLGDGRGLIKELEELAKLRGE